MMQAPRRTKKSRWRPFSPSADSRKPPLSAASYKVAELVRGSRGYGFTISGQAPCILSCVVANSPADRAGLQPGDCLLAVNGIDVSLAPHDEVVHLVGSSTGLLCLHLAKSEMVMQPSYTTSDEEVENKQRQATAKSRTPRQSHLKVKRKGTTPNRAEKSRDVQAGLSGTKQRRRRHFSSSSSDHMNGNLVASPSAQQLRAPPKAAGVSNSNSSGQLLYRTVVGYLGTIEMPDDSNNCSSFNNDASNGANAASSSNAARLAAIRSCVRRLRVEKKVHTLVLLRVWGPRPGANESSTSGKITLTSPAGANLARFPARRVVFCGAYADDARFFGLVTSASNATNSPDDSDSASDVEEKFPRARPNSVGFTSCHVFMVDSRLFSHDGHAARAHAFRFQCTPAGDGRCLEFPATAEPILQAVLSLCASSGCHGNKALGTGLLGWANPLLHQQQQQQQHNLSSSSSSSNSDSGIFRDRDDGKISDRDIQPRPLPPMNGDFSKSLGNNQNLGGNHSGNHNFAANHSGNQVDRLTVRAMPDPSAVKAAAAANRMDHTPRFRNSLQQFVAQSPQPAMLLLNRNTGTHQHVNPHLSVRTTLTLEEKLSPQVYKQKSAVFQQPTNRPARTPSVRSKARSLDDLSKQPSQQMQNLGSDMGLDKIQWEDSSQQAKNEEKVEKFQSQGTEEMFSIDQITVKTASNGPGHRDTDTPPAVEKEASEQQHVWVQGFEKLLEDPLGLRAFAGFLKKEFSHENIYFWAACEKYRRMFPTENLQLASSEGRKIFDRHLAPAAAEPVNVDSQARQHAEDNLANPGPELFSQAQKQVFNLMKFDCYPRFLRSAIYRDCVQALQAHQNLPLPEDILDDPHFDLDGAAGDDSLGSRSSKLKKSESDAGERRRRSLIPWPRKDRSKSKDRGEAEYRKQKKKNRTASTSSTGDRDHEATDDEGQLARAASKESVLSNFSDGAFSANGANSSLVKILLPDLSSAVVAARAGQTALQLMRKLLDRRGLGFTAFEVYQAQTGELIDLEKDASTLGGSEVRLEPRVFFQLLLPSGKSLLIRGQPQRHLNDVLKPIYSKYDFSQDQVSIIKVSSNDPVPPKTLLASLDGLHLKLETLDNIPGTKLDTKKSLGRRNSLHTDRSSSKQAKKAAAASAAYDSSTSLGGNKRLSLHDITKSVASPASQLMPPPLASVSRRFHKLTPRLENEALYERLKRAQRSRLEDQRGTEINFELPDFLKLPRGANGQYDESLELPLDGRASEPICTSRPRIVYQESREIPLDGRASEPIFSRREVVSDPRGLRSSTLSPFPDFAAIAAEILDRSFSSDGIIASHAQAEEYFGSQQPRDSTPETTVAAARQNVVSVAARIAGKSRAATKPATKTNTNWDDLLLDLDVDWRCYHSRETDDQKQQQLQQQHVAPQKKQNAASMMTALELLDLDDPLVATPAVATPPPLPPKPGKSGISKGKPYLQFDPPPRPPGRSINPPQINVSFV